MTEPGLINEAHAKGIASRGLSLSVATRMGIFTGRRTRDGGYEPAADGDCLCFPYIENGEVVNVKARWAEDGQKRFGQIRGATKTFWNADVLLDDERMATLEDGTNQLIITEGEFDTLAAIQCGFEYAVSVPDGAPPARGADGKLIEVPEDASGLEPSADIKFSYIGRMLDRLTRVDTIIIAVDGDEPGGRLAKEIVRRLGAARCRWVEYPTQEVVPDRKIGGMRAPKDLNEVLQYLGEEAVRECVLEAKEWPVKGLYRFSGYPDVGEAQTFPTGLCPELDEIFRPYLGAFIVLTGIPNMGKSVIAKQIAVEQARNYGWVTTMFPGEEPVKPYLFNSLRSMFLKKKVQLATEREKKDATDFVEAYFRIIGHDPRNDEEEIDVDRLLDLASTSVGRFGSKLLLTDPWNELNHQMDRNWSMTEYVGKAIRKMKRFGISHDCCNMVVAHPKKIDHEPGLYDISDSQHWANKADLGLVVHSDDPFGTLRDLVVKKARFSTAGRKGRCQMEFDREAEIYVPLDRFDA